MKRRKMIAFLIFQFNFNMHAPVAFVTLVKLFFSSQQFLSSFCSAMCIRWLRKPSHPIDHNLVRKWIITIFVPWRLSICIILIAYTSCICKTQRVLFLISNVCRAEKNPFHTMESIEHNLMRKQLSSMFVQWWLFTSSICRS